MRVLVVQGRYRSTAPSGENVSVDLTVSGLQRAGVEVQTEFVGVEPGLVGSVQTAASLLFPHQRIGRVRRVVDAFVPDVVHVENLLPQLSPKVIGALKSSPGTPVVHVVRNYRLSCIAGSLWRDGDPCSLCVESGNPASGVRHACFQDSRLRSLVMATAQQRGRGAWASADLYLATSETAARFLRRSGIDASRIAPWTNFVPDPGQPEPLGKDVLFVGRLEREKGVDDLLAAWARVDHDAATLVFVGSGDERERVARLAEGRDVRVVGMTAPSDVARWYRDARVVVAPSRVPETFGRTVIEAFAHGRPVVASTAGALSETVDAGVGWSFEPGDVSGLALALAQALKGEAAVVRGRAARERYLARYSEEHGISLLLSAYRSLVASP